MKMPSPLFPKAAGLKSWLMRNGWSSSLVVGATCGCDVSRLGREICRHLNRPAANARGDFRAFDRDEIRRLAGNGAWRERLLAKAPPLPPGIRNCDYERTAAAVAAIGGAVLSGQCCLDATRPLGTVFRVMISCCGRCKEDDPAMRLDPVRISEEAMVRVIADAFLDWCRDREEVPAGRPRQPYARRASMRPEPVIRR